MSFRKKEMKYGNQSTAGQKIIRMPKVKEKTGLGKSSIYKLMAEGKFPISIALTNRAVAWVESEVDAWIKQRIAERDNQKEMA